MPHSYNLRQIKSRSLFQPFVQAHLHLSIIWHDSLVT